MRHMIAAFIACLSFFVGGCQTEIARRVDAFYMGQSLSEETLLAQAGPADISVTVASISERAESNPQLKRWLMNAYGSLIPSKERGQIGTTVARYETDREFLAASLLIYDRYLRQARPPRPPREPDGLIFVARGGQIVGIGRFTIQNYWDQEDGVYVSYCDLGLIGRDSPNPRAHSVTCGQIRESRGWPF